MFPQSLFVSLLAVSLASASPLSTNYHNVHEQRRPIDMAPLVVEHHPHGTINNSYIIVFKDDLGHASMQNHLNFLQHAQESHPLLGDLDAGLRHVYDSQIKGYAGRFSEGLIHQIRRMPEVEYVERDQVVKATDVQTGAPWGLARVSHRTKLTFGTFTKYVYDKKGGEGVDVYVIDTGINVGHTEFEGRASWGKTMPANDVDEDGNGHGTHCAGTIASRKFGVAKAAHVIAVKVLGSNGSGSMSDVVGGVLFAADAAAKKAAAALKEFRETGKTNHKGSVANMSLGGGLSRALNDAVNRAVDSGMHFAVAAGNDNRDACKYSPASAENAVTVGASTLGDERAYFSNFGSCVDVFAPGLNIKSTYIGGPNSTTTMSGTSMASPHTAGMLAYLLSLYPSKSFNPSATPDFIPPFLSEIPIVSSWPSAYAIVHGSLPSWAATFLPSPQLIDSVAPAPKDPVTLTPKQLKKALLALSTADVLSDLPADTPNLLIFNNATA